MQLAVGRPEIYAKFMCIGKFCEHTDEHSHSKEQEMVRP
jgi:hypothetical protein